MSLAGFWEQLDERVRPTVEAQLKRAGWRLVEGGKQRWVAMRDGFDERSTWSGFLGFPMPNVADLNRAVAMNPDDLLTQVAAKNKARDEREGEFNL